MDNENYPDAFGQQLWDFYTTDQEAEIVERDDDFISVGRFGKKLYFSSYDEWDQIEKDGIAYAKGKVLDIGCGAGRHALYLQEKGLNVVAIDSSPLAIKVSQDRGVKDAKVLSIEEIDTLKDSFDTILLLGNNFGLFQSKEKMKILLEKMHTITSPDGVIIAETRDPYTTNNPLHLAYHERNRKEGRMSGQLKIRIRYNNLVGEWMDYLFVSREEMEQLLEGTGWKIEKFISTEIDPSKYVAIIKKS